MIVSTISKQPLQSTSRINLPAVVEQSKKNILKSQSKIKNYISKEWNGERTAEKTKGWIRNWFLSYNPLYVHDNHKKEIKELSVKRIRLHTIGMGLIKKLENPIDKLNPEIEENINKRLKTIYKSIKVIDKKLELIKGEVKCQNFQYLGKWSNMVLPGSGLAFNVIGLFGKFRNAYNQKLSVPETTARIRSLTVQTVQMVALTSLMFGIKFAKSALWDDAS